METIIPAANLVFFTPGDVGGKIPRFLPHPSLNAGIVCDDNAVRSLDIRKGVLHPMRIQTTDPLFPWEKLPDSPDLKALRSLLDLVPDQALLEALRAHRGKGRNDYPLAVLWRTHLTAYFLRHPTMEACLAELSRNPALRKVVGIEEGQEVPLAWNMSRFLAVLGEKEQVELLREMFEELAKRLSCAVPELGVHLAGDSAALSARKDGDGGDGSLPQPDGGKKEYKDQEGKVTKTYEWFGYKFHLLVDVKQEVVVAAHLTAGSAADSDQLPILLEQSKRVLGEGRTKTVTYDKAADDNKTHELLDQEKIRPVIEVRELWKGEPERMLPGHDGTSNVVHDEAGTIYCYDKVSDPPVKHKMSCMGFEKDRGTLKYRCPARHEGFVCPSDKRCNGESCYGKTVRVNCHLDLRRFPPIPRATMEFERRYKGRTSVERVNARLKLFWGADDGNVTGAARFHAHMMTILVVHEAMANWLVTQPRYEGKSLSPTRLSVIAARIEAANAA
jgi:hypothetical protein